MNKLLIATKNPGKMSEISHFLSDLPITLVSLQDLNINQDVVEDEKTYAGNAEKKAKIYAEISGFPTLADDTGIEIDALGGKPGRFTRRWLGYEMTDEEIIEHLKKISQELPDTNRKAVFKCTVCLIIPPDKSFFSTGEVEGIIAKESSLKILPGFPFRSFFYISQIKSFFFEDELTEEQQKLYNHRYKAIEKIKPIIKKELC